MESLQQHRTITKMIQTIDDGSGGFDIIYTIHTIKKILLPWAYVQQHLSSLAACRTSASIVSLHRSTTTNEMSWVERKIGQSSTGIAISCLPKSKRRHYRYFWGHSMRFDRLWWRWRWQSVPVRPPTLTKHRHGHSEFSGRGRLWQYLSFSTGMVFPVKCHVFRGYFNFVLIKIFSHHGTMLHGYLWAGFADRAFVE